MNPKLTESVYYGPYAQFATAKASKWISCRDTFHSRMNSSRTMFMRDVVTLAKVQKIFTDIEDHLQLPLDQRITIEEVGTCHSYMPDVARIFKIYLSDFWKKKAAKHLSTILLRAAKHYKSLDTLHETSHYLLNTKDAFTDFLAGKTQCDDEKKWKGWVRSLCGAKHSNRVCLVGDVTCTN